MAIISLAEREWHERCQYVHKLVLIMTGASERELREKAKEKETKTQQTDPLLDFFGPFGHSRK